MPDLVKQFIDMRNDGGQDVALKTLEELESSLETIIELGDETEREHAVALLSSVSNAITAILDEGENGET